MSQHPLLYTQLSIIFFVLCWIGMSLQYVFETNERITFTTYEQYGVQYHNALVPLMKELQEHRGMQAAYKSGEESFREKIIQKRKDIEKRTAQVDKMNTKFGTALQANEDWSAIKKRITKLPAIDDNLPLKEDFDLHSSVIQDILIFITHTADTSNLITDPVIYSYYLMELNVNILPQLMEYTGKIRGKASALMAAENSNLSMDNKTELMLLKGASRNLTEKMEYAYGVLNKIYTDKHNREHSHTPDLRNIYISQEQFLKEFYAFISGKKQDLATKQFFDYGTHLISAYLKIYDQNAQELESFLQERIKGFILKRNILIIFSILVILSIAFFYKIFERNYKKRIQLEQKLVDTNVNLEKQVFVRTESLRIYEAIVEYSKDAVIVTDTQLNEPGPKIIYANKAIETISGYRRDEIIGHSPRILQGKNTDKKQAHKIGKALRDGTNFSGEILNYTKDGDEYWLSISIYPIPDDTVNIVSFAAIERDITEKKKSREELLKARRQAESISARMQAILETAVDAIITIDTQGNILSFNPAASKIFGYEEQDVLNKNLKILMPPFYRKKHDDYLENYLKTGVRKIIGTAREASALRKNGEEFPIELSVSEVQSGKTKFFTGVIRDISLKKKAEDELLNAIYAAELSRETAEEAQREAEKANQVKTDFLSNMSHELRTPLNSILGMSRMLKEGALNEEQKELADTVFSSSVNLLEIVNDILDLSKIEANEVKLENIGFDLGYVLKSVCHAMELLANEKKLEFIKAYKGKHFPYVLGDPTRLSRILNNLIGNAIKYTLSGHVTVSASFKEIDAQNVEWVCEIADTGVGVPEDKIDHIFEKFTQGDISTTRKFGGTGLGLAITKQLVELMNGKIEVESVVNKGSTFRVTIPYKITDTLNNEKRRRRDITNKGTIEPKDFRILVAEDHPANQLLIEKMLEKMGIVNFDIAFSGRAVLKALEKSEYDLIFMDCHMPEKNGYDTTEEIRRTEKGTDRHIQIIAMTANAMVGDREKCLHYSMDDYISKPIDVDEVRDILGQWVKFPKTKKKNAPEDKKTIETKDDKKVSLVDLSMLDSFTCGDKDVEKEFIEIFLTESSKNVQTMKKNCTDGQNNDWCEAAHQMKGGAANIGAKELADLCAKAQGMKTSTSAKRKAIF